MVELAAELIERKAGPFNVDTFKDHYGDALKALVEQKRKRGKVSDTEEEDERPESNVVDLMEALRRSVKGGKGASAPRRPVAARKTGTGKSTRR